MPTNPADDDPMDEFWHYEIEKCIVEFLDDGFHVVIERQLKSTYIELYMPQNPSDPITGWTETWGMHNDYAAPWSQLGFQIVDGEVNFGPEDSGAEQTPQHVIRDIKLAVKKIGDLAKEL